MIQKYSLESENSPGGDTSWFDLVFESNGNMVVRVTQDFGQPFKRDRVRDIAPEDFDRHNVNGVPLRELVVQKLHEILPAPPSSKSRIKPT